MPDRPVFFDFVKTRLGTFQIAASDRGLIQINFPLRVSSLPHRGYPDPMEKNSSMGLRGSVQSKAVPQGLHRCPVGSTCGAEAISEIVRQQAAKFVRTDSAEFWRTSLPLVARNDVIKGNCGEHIRKTQSFLKHYFLSKPAFDKIPIDWNIFKPFDKKILQTLLKVKPGKTITYQQLAKRAGFPRAARAVGNALNRNPIPILIPCHRVVRKDRSLGGYAGGIRWKQALLKLEQNN